MRGAHRGQRGQLEADVTRLGTDISQLWRCSSQAAGRRRRPAGHGDEVACPRAALQVKRVRCEASGALVPKDKAIKRFIVRNIVDASAIRDLQDSCAIDGEAAVLGTGGEAGVALVEPIVSQGHQFYRPRSRPQ